MKTRSLLLKLSKRFPRSIAEKYHDYVGKMIGELPEEINRILICLDFDEEVFPRALEFKPDLILTHHPFIYGSLKEVLEYDPKKKELVDLLLEHKMCVYSMHTNFDEGEGGMNDSLAKALNLTAIYAPIDDPMMRIGYLNEEMEIHEFAQYAKAKLDVSYGLLIHQGKDNIKKVGIVGGSGSYSYNIAMKEGCDIYISGDVSHHMRRVIIRYNFNYLDLPHEIEKIFIPTMKELIKSYDSNIEILTVDHEKLPEVI